MDDGTGSSLHVTFAAVSEMPDLRLRNHSSKTTTNKLNNDRLTMTGSQLQSNIGNKTIKHNEKTK
jgi:hypothetical protein